MMDVHCFSNNYIVMFTGVYQDIQLYIRTSMIFGSRSWCRPSQSQPQHPSCVISAPGTFLQTPQIMSKCRWKLRWQYEKIEFLIGDIYIFKSLEFSSPVRFRGCSATEDSRDFQPKTKKNSADHNGVTRRFPPCNVKANPVRRGRKRTQKWRFPLWKASLARNLAAIWLTSAEIQRYQADLHCDWTKVQNLGISGLCWGSCCPDTSLLHINHWEKKRSFAP